MGEKMTVWGLIKRWFKVWECAATMMLCGIMMLHTERNPFGGIAPAEHAFWVWLGFTLAWCFLVVKASLWCLTWVWANRGTWQKLSADEFTMMLAMAAENDGCVSFSKLSERTGFPAHATRCLCENLTKKGLIRISEWVQLNGCFLTPKGRKWLMDRDFLR